jgi:hypothetical protein
MVTFCASCGVLALCAFIGSCVGACLSENEGTRPCACFVLRVLDCACMRVNACVPVSFERYLQYLHLVISPLGIPCTTIPSLLHVSLLRVSGR